MHKEDTIGAFQHVCLVNGILLHITSQADHDKHFEAILIHIQFAGVGEK